MKKSKKNYIRICALLLLLLVFGACNSDNNREYDSSISKVQMAQTDSSITVEPGKITISEVMTHNSATLMDDHGEFSDWIELYNSSDDPIDLKGRSLSDESGEVWVFPEYIIEGHGYLVVFASGRNQSESIMHTSFSLKDGEQLSLYTVEGEIEDTVFCEQTDADHSIQKQENTISQSAYATPGFENSSTGYEQWQSERKCSGPIQINEAISANLSYPLDTANECKDWIEIKNISDQDILLSEYYLSDDFEDLLLMQLPEITISSGECIVLECKEFGLNSSSDKIYLSSEEGILDYLPLIALPSDYSVGRMDDRNGYYYFSIPTPGKDNTSGKPFISELPQSVTAPGIYNGIIDLSVALDNSKATLFYTLDGSTPTEQSSIYSEPIHINRTTTLRVRAVESNAAISKTATFNFIVNEGHTLPVLCFAGDDLQKNIIDSTIGKNREKEINISFYEESGNFSMDAGLSLSGVLGSLSLEKKSYKVHFRNKYGGNTLKYDLFDGEVDTFSSLTVRSGQDGYNMIFQNALWQNLALETNGSVLSLSSRFCILYVNGEYMGIYDLKEDLSNEYYASHTGIDSNTVESEKFPVTEDGNFYQEVLLFCRENDLSVDTNYQTLCDRIDIDSFIDWFIMEGVSANIDLCRNIRVFRSVENGNKWQFAFFDIDLVKKSYSAPFAVLFGHSEYLSEQMRDIVLSVFKNENFRSRLFSRYSELYNTVLSTEVILDRVEMYKTLLEPEVDRNSERWGISSSYWFSTVDYAKRVFLESDWENACVDNLLRYLKDYRIISGSDVGSIKSKYFS